MSILTSDERSIFSDSIEGVREQYGPMIDAMPAEAKALGLTVLNMALSDGMNPEEATEAGAGAIALLALRDTGDENMAGLAARVGYAFMILTLSEIALEVVDEHDAGEVVAAAEKITQDAAAL